MSDVDLTAAKSRARHRHTSSSEQKDAVSLTLAGNESQNGFSGMRLIIAAGFWSRARGLLGTSSSWGASNQVLMLPNCKSVHTFGMRYALDIAFVNSQGTVIQSERGVRAGRLLYCGDAALVLERPSVSMRPWFVIGDELSCGCAPSSTSA